MLTKEKYAQLIKLVRAEAKNLIKNATATELKNLSFANLIPSLTTYCIYGQMTGFCYSYRAQELIEKCATRVYTTNIHEDTCEGIFEGIFENQINNLNGKPEPIAPEKRKYAYHSPIEIFILINRGRLSENNLHLIQYLKGEIKTFRPKPYKD